MYYSQTVINIAFLYTNYVQLSMCIYHFQCDSKTLLSGYIVPRLLRVIEKWGHMSFFFLLFGISSIKVEKNGQFIKIRCAQLRSELKSEKKKYFDLDFLQWSFFFLNIKKKIIEIALSKVFSIQERKTDFMILLCVSFLFLL